MLKLIFDKISAFLGLLLLWPLFIIVAILILIKMRKGSILFIQKRVGKNGKLFSMYKFKSMHVNHSGSSITIKGEKRITEFGVFLRKYKIDELPALWNELKGKDRLILKLRPGITGPASLKYSNEEELLANVKDPSKYNDEVIFPDKVRINLEYLNNWSFWMDIKIIFKTIFRKNY
jgi:lipopolysaccharide/colanic/teichoic acid biosynthesis glycosyltransferase